MKNFHAPAKPFTETGGPHRHHHKFLEIYFVVGMRAPVQNIHHGNGQHFRVGSTDITVKGERGFFSGGFCGCHTHRKNRIGPEPGFIGGSVQRNHQLIDPGLVRHVIAQQGGSDDIIDVLYRF